MTLTHEVGKDTIQWKIGICLYQRGKMSLLELRAALSGICVPGSVNTGAKVLVEKNQITHESGGYVLTMKFRAKIEKHFAELDGPAEIVQPMYRPPFRPLNLSLLPKLPEPARPHFSSGISTECKLRGVVV